MKKNNIFLKTISMSVVLSLGLITASPVFAYTKDETVYSKLSTNGSSYNTVISDHIKNNNKDTMLEDMSELLNIKNINGDEQFTSEANNMLKWQSNGNDIYYQGDTQKQLPIECSIKYELDSNEISAEELAGKSGKVKITIEYTNKEEHDVTINGKSEKMYTPFVIMTGTILDNTKAQNITITNGKTVDNGQKTLVVGISCPGLQQSLGLSENDIEIPNKIEIEYDATDFEMENIVSYATPKLIEKDDFEGLDKLSDLYSKISELSNSSKLLVQGAHELQSGLDTYVSKSSEFGTAMDQLANGTQSLKNNYGLLDDGINQINSNTSKLAAGASQVDQGVSKVQGGLSQLQGGVSDGKTKAIDALSGSAQSLDAGIQQLIDGKDQEAETIKSKVIEDGNKSLGEGLKSGLKEQLVPAVTSGVNQTVNGTLSAVLANKELGLTSEQVAAIEEAMKTNLSTAAIETGMKTGIDNGVDKAIATATEKEKAGIDAINNNEKGVKAGLELLRQQSGESIKAGITSISNGFDSITTGIKAVDAGATTLKAGTAQLNEGSKALSQGTETLANKSELLKSGIITLNGSTIQINNANKQLYAGAQTLQNGTDTLVEGLTKFDDEGIQEITNLVNNKVANLQDRVEALKDLANDYNNFSGISKDADGTVKFVLITDSIKKNEYNEEDNNNNDNK